MLYMKAVFNHIRSPNLGLHGKSCDCDCEVCYIDDYTNGCGAYEHSYNNITKPWDSFMCPKASNSVFHGLECLNGECPNCGATKWNICP